MDSSQTAVRAPVTPLPQPPSHRSSGILLHPTSLPGPFGIGDLGPIAHRWIDWLASAKQAWWQVLPLGPTGYGNSPYQCFSAFAGNPLLISPDDLVADGFVETGEVSGARFSVHQVSFGEVIAFKNQLLKRAWERFQAGGAQSLRPSFENFVHEQSHWLPDYSLFMALKDAHGGAAWQTWSPELRQRKPSAVAAAQGKLADRIGEYQFRQFLFFRQWNALRCHAQSRGIRIIGDIPIFVAGDSADVWSHPELFWLDEAGMPTVVAGVPPDYFSATGQLWGNPLYRWDAHKRDGYGWWISRLRATLQLVDLIRLDHFRGFEAYWEIPAGKLTAEIGRWVKGPGGDLFQTAKKALGGLPLIAENLGVITLEVEAIRKQFELPGMRVLQFAFSGPDNPFLPHHHDRHTVVYTGTHDNDTTIGWYQTASDAEKDYMRRYLGRETMDPAWDLIRIAWASVADFAMAPLQDLLRLGTKSRMNLPGRAEGNWGWRFTEEMMTDDVRSNLEEITTVYDRVRA